MEIDRVFQLIDNIETTMADSIDGRFLHPDIFAMLDNVNASRKEIDLLKDRSAPEIKMPMTQISPLFSYPR